VPSSPRGPDLLAAERSGSQVNSDALAELLHTKEQLALNERIEKIVAADPIFDKTELLSMGRVDRIERSLARGKTLKRLNAEHNWSKEEYKVASNIAGEPTVYGLHDSMWLVTLREQGTPEQHKLFLEKAERAEYVGCYAQTELGHGSNVRGLETTATWDPKDKTFVINSPHLTASKWWIGSLGKVANHAIVMAQLFVNGKNHGPHPFVVHIRDLKTHEPLENIYVGDIGPKFGYNSMDNGFLLFNHVKIPHVNMLARFNYVDPNTSEYRRVGSPSLIYGTLTWVRSNIVLDSGSSLARGVAIATRYAAVRRQFQDRDAEEAGIGGETPVLNYKMVQARLLPLLAASYALHFTGRGMMELYNANQEAMKKNLAAPSKRSPGPEELNSGADLLADLHSTSCGLKALGSTIAVDGLEMCRRACGGHGYSSYSGIGSWYSDYLPTATWEGDNYMLTQQVARYMLKTARAVINGTAPDNETSRILKHYLSRKDTGAAFDVLNNDQDIVSAFAWRTAYLTFEALRLRDKEKQSWNSLLVHFWRLSTAHSQYLVVRNFHDAVVKDQKAIAAKVGEPTAQALIDLYRLFALTTLEAHGAEFFTAGAVTTTQISLTRTKGISALLDAVRPNAVKLVDAWAFSDYLLNSSLGRKDGAVYEDLFKRAWSNPVNNLTFDPYPTSKTLIKRVEREAKL
jgi:acyl-CoA oxidase